MMGISPKLAEMNAARFKNFQTRAATGDNFKQAILVFKGDVYLGLDVDTWNERDHNFAQKHLRILSGLYGLLRPLDMIQPYRLEMGTRLKTKKGENLYDFWGKDLELCLARELESHRNKTLVNLASREYFKAVAMGQFPGRLITPVFKDYSNGTYKVLMFFAKKARGAMSSFIVKNRINKPEDIKDFDEDGYSFSKSRSTDAEWVFTRKLTR